MYLIGLTGSIGMGKTRTAVLFEDLGIACYDADARVHALYEKNGAAVAPIAELFPAAVVDAAVDRVVLGKAVLKDKDKLKQIEKIVHPLVAQSQMDFLTMHAARKAAMVLLDIPLLFETGGDQFVDCVVVVSTSPEIQKQRVLARPGMDKARFNDILDKQMPDVQKRARANFIVDSSISVEDVRHQVRAIVENLEGRVGSAYAARKTRLREAQDPGEVQEESQNKSEA